MTRAIMTRRQWSKIVESNRLHRICLERGSCRRSGDQETRLLARQTVLMERCADCHVLCPVDGNRWAS